MKKQLHISILLSLFVSMVCMDIFGNNTESITNNITGTVNWDNRKNLNYWYARNSTRSCSGLEETHANVWDVEKMSGLCDTLFKPIYAIFQGNRLVNLNSSTDMDNFITLRYKDGSGTPVISGKDLTLSLQFTEGTFNTFKGYYAGNKIETIHTYVSDKNTGGEGRALMAWVDYNTNSAMDSNEPRDTIATLEFTDLTAQDINHMIVKYHTTDIAKALLNWRSHNDLRDDVLTAYVTVKAQYDSYDIPLECEPICIRFLRPIDASQREITIIEDTKRGADYYFNLIELIKLIDWRDIQFWSSFWHYYDIQKIEIDAAGSNIYDAVLTNLNQTSSDSFVKLSSLNSQINLQYYPNSLSSGNVFYPDPDDYGVIAYRNLSSTDEDFDLKFKLRVTYYWGYVITDDIIIHVSRNTAITLDNDMQTYCPLDDVDFSNVEGLRAFTATGYDHGTLTVSRVLNAPAGTGLLLQGTAGVTYKVPYATQTGYYINLLHGLTQDTQVSPTTGDQTNFLLGKKDGVTTFYRVAQTGTVSAGKAYLQLPTSVVGDLAGSRVMRIVADDETTGISEALPLNDNGELKNDNVYDLQGRRVEKPTRGLYIVNGRKVVIK